MRRKRILWFRISRSLICLVILGFGTLGLILSLQRLAPTVAVSGGRVGFFVQMFLDMMEFAHSGL